MIEIRCHTPQDLDAILTLHAGIFPLLTGGLPYQITAFRDGRWVAVAGRSQPAITAYTTKGWVAR